MDLDAAERFMWTSARLIERLRFDCLFRDGSAERVVAALRPYQEPDGGFAGALEPDFRGPVSQPTTCLAALDILDEIGEFEPSIVDPVLAWLATVTTDEGGVPTVLANAAPYPKAPWWSPAPGTPASLLPTAGLAGLLYNHGIDDPWLGPATDFCWRALGDIPARVAAGEFMLQVTYDVRTGLRFLEHVPDRARAEKVASELGRLLVDAGAVTLDVRGDETATPLDMAPRPDSIARSWVSDEVVDRHLDAVEQGQAHDGGWTVPWDAWTPAAGLEWRGWQTIEQLQVLRANGRF
jgi:hypothetical protein